MSKTDNQYFQVTLLLTILGSLFISEIMIFDYMLKNIIFLFTPLLHLTVVFNPYFSFLSFLCHLIQVLFFKTQEYSPLSLCIQKQ